MKFPRFLVPAAIAWSMVSNSLNMPRMHGAFRKRVQPSAPTIPLVDLAMDHDRQVVVDREEGQYLGHPTTVLLEDGKTILCVYPKGHGKGAILMSDRRMEVEPGVSDFDAEKLGDQLETPTIHRVIDAQGKKRLLLWSGAISRADESKRR